MPYTVFWTIACAVLARWWPTTYDVDSRSMAPTLEPGDILVSVRPTKARRLRGRIVVFLLDAMGTPVWMTKRVVAVGGDLIQVVDGVVHVRLGDEPGALLRPIAEPYLPPGARTDRLPATIVPKEHVFLLGDNREDSYDSRMPGLGPLPLSGMAGRGLLVIKRQGQVRLL